MQISSKTSQKQFGKFKEICGKLNRMRCRDGVLRSGAVLIVTGCLDAELFLTINMAAEMLL